jgi:Family of unknown function (DUF6455)
MTDFCVSARTLTRISRQTDLMDRMCTYLGVAPDGYQRGVGNTLWCEARFRCIACERSYRCAAFLAALAPGAPPRTPAFCAHAEFFYGCTRTNHSTTIPLGGSP